MHSVGYQSGTIPTYGAKENTGGLREKARANAIPHMQAEANAARDGAKVNAWVAWDGAKAKAWVMDIMASQNYWRSILSYRAPR